MAGIRRLQASELYQACDPDLLDFETTDDLEELAEIVGQPRAVEALRFGMGVGTDGHNIYAMGPAGTPKREFVLELFRRQARSEHVPDDWCYVNNMDQPHKPRAICLPPGMGRQFQEDMQRATQDFGSALAAAFESEEYQTRREAIVEELQEQQSAALEELQQRVRQEGLALIRTPGGFVFAPVRDGDVLSPEQLQQLSEDERQELQRTIEKFQDELQQILRQVPGWQRERRERLGELNREMAEFAVSGVIVELKEKYTGFADVIDFMGAVQEDVVRNAEAFVPSEQQEQQQRMLQMLTGGVMGQATDEREPLLRRYQVNLIVDHQGKQGAPVVYEDNPTYQNLVGRVEHRAQMGVLITDFHLIKGGTLHEANGGYLVLDVRKVLAQPYAWDALKRALQSKDIRIESLGQRLGLISTVSLEPEAIPLSIKVALFGDQMLYYLLWYLDPEFRELFKVAADFAGEMDRDAESQRVYAQLVGSLVKEHGLQPFDRSAIARVIEHSSRIMGDAAKLSTEVHSIADLLQEANYWARDAGSSPVSAEHVQKAIDARIYRVDRVREQMQEQILRDTVLISTEGEHVGQITGFPLSRWATFGSDARRGSRRRYGSGEARSSTSSGRSSSAARSTPRVC